MDWIPTHVPYRQTGYFSRIITDYLDKAEPLSSFYTHPISAEGMRASLEARPIGRGLHRRRPRDPVHAAADRRATEAASARRGLYRRRGLGLLSGRRQARARRDRRHVFRRRPCRARLREFHRGFRHLDHLLRPGEMSSALCWGRATPWRPSVVLQQPMSGTECRAPSGPRSDKTSVFVRPGIALQ